MFQERLFISSPKNQQMFQEIDYLFHSPKNQLMFQEIHYIISPPENQLMFQERLAVLFQNRS